MVGFGFLPQDFFWGGVGGWRDLPMLFCHSMTAN